MKRTFLLFFCILTLIMSTSSPILHAEPLAAEPPVIQADSAILIDAKSKTILFEKNAHKKQYPASITKIMTALLAIENLSPTDVITFSKDAIFSIERGSSHIGMDVGEQITVDQALHAALLMSANEVANGLAEAVSGSIDNFAEKMTQRAKELGAKNTHFVNPHGLHDPNHYTTAYDMAMITSYIYSNPYFQEIMKDTTYQIPSTNKTNEIRYLSQQHRLMNKQRDSRMFREDVIGGKTGYTDVARHTLVTIAKHGDIELIVVIMKAERDSAYIDTNALLDYGINSYRSLSLPSPNTILKTLPMYSVKSGKTYQAGNCGISVDKPLSLLVRNDIKERDIKTQIELPDYIGIGANKGDIVGNITYMHNSEILAKNNLLIKSIDFSPSPYATIPPEQNKLLPDVNLYLVIGLSAGIIILLFLFKKLRRRRRTKFKLGKRIR